MKFRDYEIDIDISIEDRHDADAFFRDMLTERITRWRDERLDYL